MPGAAPQRGNHGDATRVVLKLATVETEVVGKSGKGHARLGHCLLYTSDAADERSSVDLGGRRIIKKKTYRASVRAAYHRGRRTHRNQT